MNLTPTKTQAGEPTWPRTKRATKQATKRVVKTSRPPDTTQGNYRPPEW